MKSVVEVDIRILKGGWKIAEESDDMRFVKRLKVVLEISGSEKNGYHLSMIPEGCGAADYHFQTCDQALEEAKEIFGNGLHDWK